MTFTEVMNDAHTPPNNLWLPDTPPIQKFVAEQLWDGQTLYISWPGNTPAINGLKYFGPDPRLADVDQSDVQPFDIKTPNPCPFKLHGPGSEEWLRNKYPHYFETPTPP